LVAHFVRDEGAAGSNPVIPILTRLVQLLDLIFKIKNGRSDMVAQLRIVAVVGLLGVMCPELSRALPPAEVALDHSPETAVSTEKIEKALGELTVLTKRLLQQNQVPGLAIAVVYQDQVVYLQGFGVQEVGKADPITPDTVFQLASLSKPLTSTILARVVGQTPITWDDPVVKHDPNFALDAPYVTANVTLRDLLSHRSGLPDHAGDLLEDLGFDQATVATSQ